MARNKGLAKAKRCLKLKKQGKVAAARQAGCSWPSRAKGLGRSRKRRKAKRGKRGLKGHVRTCLQYKCVRGRGRKNADAACKTGYVLRCATYAAKPGIPRTAATRKPYQEFTYGRYNRGKGQRSIYPPRLKPHAMVPMQKRVRHPPRGAVQPGPGRK
jgi:hypothetical protein